MKTALIRGLFLFTLLCSVVLLVYEHHADAKEAEIVTTEAAAKLPKLLDLGAHKCIACRMMAPVLAELGIEYKGIFDVEFIDVWQTENLAKAKAHRVRSIPTQIFFDAEGKELWRHVGFISKNEILNKWRQLGVAFDATHRSRKAE